MKLHVKQLATLWFICAAVITPGPASAESNRGGQIAQELRATISGPQKPGTPTTLAELERLALQNNPTLEQAAAATRSARGLAKQAGLLPNPVVGYQSEEFAFRALSHKPEYFGFFEQTLPLGGKLAKSRRIYLSQANQAEIEADAQKQRVINTVRTLFYQTLGAQQQVDLRTELAKIAHDATKTTSDLFNVGQADKPDYLESEIETEQVDHELQTARNSLRQTWKLLASVAGVPEMTPVRLEGKLDDRIPSFNEDQLLATVMRDSPQIKSAEAQVARARAVVIRAKAEPIPDMYLRGGIGYSSEFLENSQGQVIGKSGVEGNMQVGVSLPLWNRNQGGITSAQADLAFAESELARLRLALRVQFAQAIKNYDDARDAVRRYRDVMLPRADLAYQLYLDKYKQMGASYPQVLISQRTMFQLREHYISALVELQQNATALEGYLLTGGLDAPSLQPGRSVVHVEMSGGSGSQGNGDQDALNTAGLVEY
jgi:cobalt-zinc-cadmium efflux system outer membrane protein